MISSYGKLRSLIQLLRFERGSNVLVLSTNIEDVSNLPEVENNFHYGEDNELQDIKFTKEKVKAKLRKLKPTSAPGPDQIWPRVLQRLASTLCIPLAIIFSTCMAEGSVPPDWKLANVTPIFKKGSKGDPANYRPVSLTSVCC